MPVSPASDSITICTENVENVVKPPRKPTPIPSLTSLENQPPATSSPSRKEPATLIATVIQSSPWW
jgi:hypothetical protein